MRKYKTFPYESGYCLASCLQSVLDRKGFPVPKQSKIVAYFEKKDRTLILKAEALNKFLEKYNLKSEHEQPGGITEPDLIIKQALKNNLDILVAYSFNLLFNDRESHLGHISLISDFQEGREKEVMLFDPILFLVSVSLPSLVKAIEHKKYANSGFYLIN